VSEPTITCPKCETEIRLTDSLAGPLIDMTKRQYEKVLAEKDRVIQAREEALRAEKSELEKQRRLIEETVAQKLETERQRISSEEAAKAKRLVAGDLDARSRKLAELEEVLNDRSAKLAEAQKVQAEFVEKERKLEDERRAMELTIQTRITAGLGNERAKAKQEAEDAMKLRVSEKDQIIASMQNTIADLKRKAEQGSQQLQGEVLELELESLLKTKFPLDVIEPVGKGELGGDIVQRVISAAGVPSGDILWEMKRTKN
jgi:hypothetical protein